jgi:hypothetical protein
MDNPKVRKIDLSSPAILNETMKNKSNLNSPYKPPKTKNISNLSEFKNTPEILITSLKHQLYKQPSSRNKIKLKVPKQSITTRPSSLNNSQNQKKNINEEIDFNLKNLDEEVQLIDKETIRKKEITALLKTSLWEKENSINKSFRSKNTIELENGEFNMNFRTQIDSINAIAIMKEKMYSRLKTREHPRIFKDLFGKESENEQRTIMKHIFQNKQTFNFEIFGNPNVNNSTNNIRNINFDEQQAKDFPETRKNNFDFLFKFEVKEMINENKIYDVEQYKLLIREKNKVEVMYRKQLMQIAQEIIEFKIKKHKLEIINSHVHSDLKKSKDDYHVRKFLKQNSSLRKKS